MQNYGYIQPGAYPTGMLPPPQPQQQQLYGYDPAYVPMQKVNGFVEDNNVYEDDEDDYDSDQMQGDLSTKKSFTGPPQDGSQYAILEHRRQSMRKHSMRSGRSRSANRSGDGLARHGSIFEASRDRSTQVMVSMHGTVDEDAEVDELKQYYGDMAGRNEQRTMDGLRGVRSYRGDIEDGDDVGKPRRVTNARNVHGRSATGYGGINFKRDIAMRKGEQWGNVEIRGRQPERPKPKGRRMKRSLPEIPPEPPQRPPEPFYPPMMNPMPMYGPVDLPMTPMVFEQQDVGTYSNLSDAFSEGEREENEEMEADNEFS